MKVGVIGGGFKPPHKGHYELAKQALAQVPDLDKMIIFVGKNVRDGITQDQSVAIWDLYKDSLGSNVEIIPATKPPIGHIYSYASKNPEDQVYWFLGARDEEDKADIADRTSYLEKNREKYPNLNVEVVESTGTDVSGTAARKALRAGDKESFFDFIPDVVDKDKVYDIVKTPETKMADAIDELFANFMYEEQEEVEEVTKGSHVAPIAVLPSEERQKLQNYTKILQDALPEEFDVEYRQDHIRVSVPYFDKEKDGRKHDGTLDQPTLPEQTQEEKFNFTPHIASILEYCITKGMKVVPIPEVKIRHDEENAANLFGRTGYYQPDTQEIVLYATGRHPKDVLRSFCHELIHHMQNLEGQNLTFYTTDVHADENLKAIEQEAHAKGSFLFRDWENSNKEQAPVDEGLWANINAKKKAGKKSSHKNSNAYKAAKSAGEKLEKTKESVNEAAIFESLSPSEKVALVRQVLRLQKTHGDNFEKIAARLTMPGSKLAGVGKAFGKRFVEAVLAEGKYDTITNSLSRIAFEAFKDAYDRGDKRAEFEFRVGNPEHDDVDIETTQFEFDFMGVVNFTEDTYKVDGGANAGLDDDGEEIQPMINVNFQIPKNPDWQEVSMDLKDVVRHELEHLTQDGENIRSGKYIPDDQDVRKLIDAGLLDKDTYFSLPKEVDAMIQGLYYKAKKSKQPFADVVNAYLDKAMISLDNKEKVLNLWRKRLPALGIKQEL